MGASIHLATFPLEFQNLAHPFRTCIPNEQCREDCLAERQRFWVLTKKAASPTHLIKILSIRAPGVKRPNLVPRSYTKLNSTYRPRRNNCHRRSSSVYGILIRRFMMGMYDGRNPLDMVLTILKISSADGFRMGSSGRRLGMTRVPCARWISLSVVRSSKKMPPTPRLSPR